MPAEPEEVNFLLTMLLPTDGNADALIVKAYNALAGEGLEPLALAKLEGPAAANLRAAARPAPALGYSRTEAAVTLTMTPDDYDRLMLLLGTAAANPRFQNASLALVNNLNQGRPLSEWRPYAVPDADKVKP